jgi:Fungal N-terminal domain of STAND proteins
MDPLTIVASVAATSRVVTTISKTLFRFIRDTKQVDRTVDALLGEVNDLKRVISAIENVIQQPATQAVIQQDRECNLGNSVDDSLVECRTTLESLDRILQGIKVKKRSQSPFWQAVKQIKVNWNSEELGVLRGQMHSHCLSMQLALQTITV